MTRSRALVSDLLDELRPSLRRRAGAVEADVKRDGSPVTAVDVEVEERLAAAIGHAFGRHAVLSEEHRTRHDGADWTWVIDPIDGTSNYAAGLPYWCVSVALTLRGEVVYAVVDAPPLHQRYEAVAGEGAALDGRPVTVRPGPDLRDHRNGHIPLLLSTGLAKRSRGRTALNPRVMGSAALDLCQVAAGSAAAAINLRPKVWDHAAGALIVREAGGCYQALGGRSLLPLEAGVEYGGREGPAVAGPDAAWVRGLLDALGLADPDLPD